MADSGSFLVGEFNSILASPLGFLPSLDHLICPIQHRLRNVQADLLRRLEIDHQLDLIDPLHWQVLRVDTVRMRWTYFADRRPISSRLTL